jgi:hypothetical protein
MVICFVAHIVSVMYFVTLDRNLLEFQQNIKILPFGIVVVCARYNRIADLVPHIAGILAAACRVVSGTVESIGL